MIRGRGRLAGAVIAALALAVALAAPQPSARAQDRADELAAHDLLWMEAVAAALAVVAMPDVDKVPAAEVKTAQQRLERAVVRLIGSRPPVSRLPQHLAVLPFLQEVTAATLAVVDARDAGDAPGLASARGWLEQSVRRLSAALRMAGAGRS